MKIQLLKMDSLLMSGFLFLILNVLSLLNAGCRAGNTGTNVILYRLMQSVRPGINKENQVKFIGKLE